MEQQATLLRHYDDSSTLTTQSKQEFCELVHVQTTHWGTEAINRHFNIQNDAQNQRKSGQPLFATSAEKIKQESLANANVKRATAVHV